MLYALSVADVTMLAALVFVLARNIIKLIVERRRALPFARFRAKLVAVLLGMTLIPSVLVLIVGSELIRKSADRWFNAPMDEVLSSANTDRERLLSRPAEARDRPRAAASRACCPASCDVGAPPLRAVRDIIAPEVTLERLQMVEVYRVQRGAEARPPVSCRSSTSPRRSCRRVLARAGRPARRAGGVGGAEQRVARAARRRRRADARGGAGAIGRRRADRSAWWSPPTYLTGELAERSRRMTAAYEDYHAAARAASSR